MKRLCCLAFVIHSFLNLRRAYWGFADHFKEHADSLLNSLEHNHRRMLQSREGAMSNSSSSNSLHTTGRMSTAGFSGSASVRDYSTRDYTMPKSRQASFTSSQENLLEKRATATLTRKNSGIPVYSPIKTDCKYLCFFSIFIAVSPILFFFQIIIFPLFCADL